MTPQWCQLRDVLAPETFSRVIDEVGTALQRRGPDASWSRPTNSTADPLLLDDSLRRAVTDALSKLVPLVRSELGIPHFALGAIEFGVSVDSPAGSFYAAPALTDDLVERHIDFVYHLTTASADAAVRLLDRGAEPVAPSAAAPGFTDVAAVDNSIVFFPSGMHHELVGGASSRPGAAHLTLRGWICSAVKEPPRPSATRDPHRIAELQSRYLPRFSASGFEIRPTPAPVHELLRSLLELRGGRLRAEDADRVFHLGGDNDFIDVTDLTAEILYALQPLHERFAGVELVPSALYGLRSYREGARLAMHTDRVETHVISSIIQVAQDVDECWPLQLAIGSRVHEVVLSPGQLLLYEGASTMHGRVRPLRGRSFVNVFAHYRPVGWDWTEAALLDRAAISEA